MAEHQHGTMDTAVQEKVYTGFLTFITRSCIALIVFALFLAVFAT
ncbi:MULTISPECIES: aa3-type cytochrome c oxidase subunit IV [Leisingera]|nr:MULTISPECIES: aa3-type cytochrome c oxidase subunit IV [Leisingera]